MAEEEKNEQQTDAEQPQEPAPPAAAAPAAAEPAAAEAEEGEQLSPRMRRRLERSRATGPAQAQRSPEERAQERAAERARKVQARSRWRKKRRTRDSERKSRDSGSGIAGSQQDAAPSAAAEPGKRKIRQGIVVSSKPDRTITVRIDRVGRHRVYGKVVRGTTTLHAHDERNEANEGDVVRVVESRPLSRLKRWRLVEILQKAK
jgi:small subunit ribosomal protein S17